MKHTLRNSSFVSLCVPIGFPGDNRQLIIDFDMISWLVDIRRLDDNSLKGKATYCSNARRTGNEKCRGITAVRVSLWRRGRRGLDYSNPGVLPTSRFSGTSNNNTVEGSSLQMARAAWRKHWGRCERKTRRQLRTCRILYSFARHKTRVRTVYFEKPIKYTA